MNIKDRGQVLQMAGNIAGGVMAGPDLGRFSSYVEIAEVSVTLSLLILGDVDKIFDAVEEKPE